jgi:hypothetical protein
MSKLLEIPVNRNAEAAYKSKKYSTATVLLMLFSRTVLFVVFQFCFYVFFSLLEKNNPWMMAASYWPFVMILTNIVCATLLSVLLKQEGSRFKEFFVFDKTTILKDLFLAIGLFFIIGGLGFLPSPLLGNWLFGDAVIGNRLFFQPLADWAVVVTLVLFPLSMPFGELTTYFGYVMPRLEVTTKSKALSIVLPALMLSFQHAALPLLFNLGGRFLLWRALVFLPFSFALAFVIRWKPRLFPYFLIGHFLIDIGTAVMFLVPMA